MTPDPEKLAGRALIEAATARLAQADTGLTAAQRAKDAAHRACEQAVAGVGDLTPLDAETALEPAAKHLRVAQKIHAAATDAHKLAESDAQTPAARAEAPRLFAGIRGRIAAAEKGERARAMLAEAEAEFADATGLIDQATQAGLPAYFPTMTLHHGLDLSPAERTDIWTAESERARWASVYVDPDRETSPWLSQLTKGA